jgi:hypothetical protein
MLEHHATSITIQTIGEYSQSRRSSTDDTKLFYAGIIFNLRNGMDEYLFRSEQVKELQKRLKPTETLNIISNDGIYNVSLKKFKGEN